MSPPSLRTALEFKILIVGDDGVGKTSLIIRFINNSFTESAEKVLEGDLMSKKLELFGAPIKVQIQDSSSYGWEDVSRYLVPDADGVMIALDVSSKAKMKPYIDFWIDSIRRYNTEVPILIVGNKNDLQKKVNIPKIAQYIAKVGSNFIEVSAKSNENVGYAFKLLTSEIVKHKAAAKKRHEDTMSDGSTQIFSRF